MSPENYSFVIALIIKPFAFLVVVAFLLGIRFTFAKYFPSGKLKNILLHRIGR